MGSQWCSLGGDTTAGNALHPAQRRLVPGANTERSCFTFNAALNISEFTCSPLPSRRLERRRDVGERCQDKEARSRCWMRNDEWSISISTIGLRTLWTRMYDGDVLHRDDVNVETARSEPYGRHAAEELFELLDAREHVNRSRRRLVWKRRAYAHGGVEEFWLINKADRRGAIERRDLFNFPARNMPECDNRFGKRGDRVVEICSDP